MSGTPCADALKALTAPPGMREVEWEEFSGAPIANGLAYYSYDGHRRSLSRYFLPLPPHEWRPGDFGVLTEADDDRVFMYLGRDPEGDPLVALLNGVDGVGTFPLTDLIGAVFTGREAPEGWPS